MNTDSFIEAPSQPPVDFYNSNNDPLNMDSAEYESEILDKNQKRAKYIPVANMQSNNLASLDGNFGIW